MPMVRREEGGGVEEGWEQEGKRKKEHDRASKGEKLSAQAMVTCKHGMRNRMEYGMEYERNVQTNSVHVYRE